jgi:hypothetical protein
MVSILIIRRKKMTAPIGQQFAIHKPLDNECPITLVDIINPAILFPCGHMFSKEGVKQWEDKSKNEECSICNRNYTHICTTENEFYKMAKEEENKAKNILIDKGFLWLVLGVAALAATIIIGIAVGIPPIIAIGAVACVAGLIAWAIIFDQYNKADHTPTPP